MGYFDDVKISSADSPKGKVVTITVKEKPAVREVKFEGNKEIDTKDLQDQIGLKRFAVYKPAAVKEAEQKIIQMYRDKGYYDVKVTSQVITLPKGDLGIKFNIVEGEKVYISKIEIRGNKSFPGKRAQGGDEHRGKGLAFLDQGRPRAGVGQAGAGRPEAQRLLLQPRLHVRPGGQARGDPHQRRPVAHHQHRGRPPLLRSPAWGISGQLIAPQKELAAMIKTKPGGWYNREQLRNDLATLHELYANRGFAYVEVRPQVRQNMKTHSVALDFQVNKGAKVYFDRIIISGNTRTRDKVIRRELGVAEGDLFSATAIRSANMRLHRLNFFEDITISPSKGGEPGTMDLNIKVKEKRTGQVSFGGRLFHPGFLYDHGPAH